VPGIGSTIGTGIFFVLSTAVPEAGPAVVLSFVLAAVTAALTALCYAVPPRRSSSPSSGWTPSPPPAKRSAIRAGTCRGRSSAPWWW
jgi:hypothetical protein